MTFRKRLFVGIVLFAAVVCIAPAEAAQAAVKIMSYNVRHCKGVDNKPDAKRTAARIKGENPDFVCLNEIKPGKALALGRLSGMFATPCGMRSANAILSRTPPVRIEEVALPWAAYGPRSLMICEFRDFAVGVMHFDCGEKSLKSRVESAAVVRGVIERYSKPVFIAGDWNSEPQSGPVVELKKSLKILSPVNVRTWHGFGKHRTMQPGKMEYCIDYIAVDAKSADRVAVVETHVVKDDATSDHYPVVVTLSLSDGSSAR